MPFEKQSGVGFPTPGSYLVFKIMNCSIWTCSKSLMPYSIQFINNYKFLLQPLLGPAFLFFFLSPTPILLFSSISMHWSLRKGFLPLFAILWNSAFIWGYLSFSPLLFAYLLSTAIYEASSAILIVCISFSCGWSCSRPPVRCHEPPSIVHQALCLSDLVS